MTSVKIQAKKKIRGSVEVPGDKSISHRALILGAMAHGTSTVKNYLPAEDTLNTLNAIKALGVKVSGTVQEGLSIEGNGIEGFSEPSGVLDLGNSGTGIRLLSGLLASCPFKSVLTGDESLRKRPMGRIIEPLKRMGANIEGKDGGASAPLTIKGGGLKGIKHSLKVASAQVKSAIIIAGLSAGGVTEIEMPGSSRDHTEIMLRMMGASIESEGGSVKLEGPQKLKAAQINVPGDMSSAIFLIVASILCEDGDLKINNVGINPLRTGAIDVLTAMGADIEITNVREVCGEKVGDIRARSSELKAIRIDGDLMVRSIDEFPILSVAAARSDGVTEFAEASELRVKESDRISSMANLLKSFGVEAEETREGLKVKGAAKLNSATVESGGDHRIAMSGAIAGLIASGNSTIIDNFEYVETSFPGFERVLMEVSN